MTEYKKNPYFYASGAESIKSSLVSVETRDENEQDLKITKNVRFSNIKTTQFNSIFFNNISGADEKTTQFKSFFFNNISGGEDPMFYFITNLNGPDAAIVYVRPEVYDASGLDDQVLYTAFGRMDTYPESTSYEYKTDIKAANWEDPYGFKIFLPDKIFRKGKLYIGLKPQQGD